MKYYDFFSTCQWFSSLMFYNTRFTLTLHHYSDTNISGLLTGTKNKMQLTETKSKRRAFCSQKVRHPELEERLCDYMDNKRQFGCTVTTEMCQLKALAVTKEPGITSFKATLRLYQVAADKLVQIWLQQRGLAWRGNGQPCIAPTCHAGLYLCETRCSCNVSAD